MCLGVGSENRKRRVSSETSLRLCSVSGTYLVGSRVTGGPSAAGASLTSTALLTASPPATPLRPRVFFVDQLRNVRAEAAAEGRQAVSLEWKPPHARAAVRCTCSEGDELAEVLGAHLRRCVAAQFGAIRGAILCAQF